MRTVQIKYETIEDAAALLVAAAPARGDYYGVGVRAKYATTRPADVVEQYARTIRERGWSYWSRLGKAQRDKYRCECGASGCKLWREYQTGAPRLLCAPCALKNQGKEGPIDEGGYRETDIGRCDQIGWYVPAVPDVGGDTFWGYTSVPDDGVKWWRALPSYPVKG